MSVTYARNITPARVEMVFTKNDTIDITFSVVVNGEDYDLTGGRLDMQVRNKYRHVHRTFTSAGEEPTITILSNTFTIYSTTPFDTQESYWYDVQFISSTGKIMTIMRGKLYVEREYTEILT